MRRRAVQVWPPGDFIREEMLYRKMSRDDLAAALDLSLGQVADLLLGKLKVTGKIARGLGDVFGTSTSLWVNLQRAIDSWQKLEDDLEPDESGFGMAHNEMERRR